MAETSQGTRIIGATFARRSDAELAVEALEEMGISPINIQIVVQLNAHSAGEIYTELLADRGFSAEMADYYGRQIGKGRTLVAVYDVVDCARVIDILDEFRPEFNPDGSRNVRNNDIGMTTGAVASG